MKAGLFEWRYYIWLIPLDLLVVLVLIARPPLEPGELISWILLALMAHGLMALPFALIRKQEWIVGNFSREVAGLVIVGMVRGFAILDIGLLMDLPQLEPYLLRPLNSAVAVPTWFIIVHFLVGSRRDFAEDYRALYVKIVREKLARLDGAKSKLSIKEIEARIEEVLAPLRATTEALQGSRISPERLAEEALIIQSYVEEKIRPLSHELWQKKEVKAPSLGQLRLLYITVLRTRLPIGATILPSAVYSVVSLAAILDFRDALIHQFVISGSFLLVYLIYRFVFSNPRNLALVNLIAFTACLLLPRVASSLLTEFSEVVAIPDLGESVGQLWFFFLLISFGAAFAVSKYHMEIMSVLRTQLEQVMITSDSKEYEEIANRFARYLHGEIQSELLSASMLMNQAANNHNSQIGRRGIERTAEILRRSHADYVVGPELSSEAKMQKIVNAWAGIADIEVKITGAQEVKTLFLDPLCEVVEELVSNSVRHGGARNISVDVRVSGERVSVSYEDDGAKRRSGKPGMGTAIFDSKTHDFKSESTDQRNLITFDLLL